VEVFNNSLSAPLNYAVLKSGAIRDVITGRMSLPRLYSEANTQRQADRNVKQGGGSQHAVDHWCACCDLCRGDLVVTSTNRNPVRNNQG
jgi:hypothetical protein